MIIEAPYLQAWVLADMARASAALGGLDRPARRTRSPSRTRAPRCCLSWPRPRRRWGIRSGPEHCSTRPRPPSAPSAPRTGTREIWLTWPGLRRRPGDPVRAEVLFGEAEMVARAVTSPRLRVSVLAGLAKTARAAAPDRAAALFDEAEAVARAVADEANELPMSLTDLAQAVAEAGDLDRAEALAHAVPGPDWQAEALAQLAQTAAKAGDLDRAVALAHAVPDPDDRAGYSTRVAQAAADAGELSRAETLAARAEAATEASTYQFKRVLVLASLVEVVYALGLSQAGELADRVRWLPSPSPALTSRRRRSPTWPRRWRGAGDLDRAEALVGAEHVLAPSATRTRRPVCGPMWRGRWRPQASWTGLWASPAGSRAARVAGVLADLARAAAGASDPNRPRHSPCRPRPPPGPSRLRTSGWGSWPSWRGPWRTPPTAIAPTL